MASRRVLRVRPRSGSNSLSTQRRFSAFALIVPQILVACSRTGGRTRTGLASPHRTTRPPRAAGAMVHDINSSGLPDLPEARDLVRDPDEIANVVLHRGEFEGEEQRDIRQVMRPMTLRLLIELRAGILVAQAAR